MDEQIIYIVVRKKDLDNSFLKIDSLWTDADKAMKRLELVQKALYSNESASVQTWKPDFAPLKEMDNE